MPIRPGAPSVKRRDGGRSHFGCTIGALGDVFDANDEEIGVAQRVHEHGVRPGRPSIAAAVVRRGIRRLGALLSRAR